MWGTTAEALLDKDAPDSGGVEGWPFTATSAAGDFVSFVSIVPQKKMRKNDNFVRVGAEKPIADNKFARIRVCCKVVQSICGGDHGGGSRGVHPTATHVGGRTRRANPAAGRLAAG
jgi:hypothetical protein